MNNWMENLDVGHFVAFLPRRGTPHLKRVESVSKLYVTVGGSKYRKSDGYRAGSSGFDRSKIHEPTQEVLEKIKRFNAIGSLRGINYDELTNDCLNEMLEVYRKHKND